MIPIKVTPVISIEKFNEKENNKKRTTMEKRTIKTFKKLFREMNNTDNYKPSIIQDKQKKESREECKNFKRNKKRYLDNLEEDE
jgi:hypothetical protein